MPNRENCQNLADYLRQPEVNFWMPDWITDAERLRSRAESRVGSYIPGTPAMAGIAHLMEEGACGTAACMAGSAWLGPMGRSRDEWDFDDEDATREVADWLGLYDCEADHLFTGSGTISLGDVTKEMAIRHLEMLASGELDRPSWSAVIA